MNTNFERIGLTTEECRRVVEYAIERGWAQRGPPPLTDKQIRSEYYRFWHGVDSWDPPQGAGKIKAKIAGLEASDPK